MQPGARFESSRGTHGSWMVHDAREVSERCQTQGERRSIEYDMYNI